MNLTNRRLLDGEARQLFADSGLLVLRLAAGVIFVAHGWGDASQEGGAGANVENYRGAGIPLPEVTAWFGAYLQLLGGAALVVGALTRLVSAGLAAVMVGALVFVHAGEPLVLAQDGSGSGFALSMFAASVALLGTGAGRFSADWLVAGRRSRTDRALGVKQPSGVS